MTKRIMLIIAILAACCKTNGQGLPLGVLLKLTVMSNDDATKYITQTQKFAVIHSKYINDKNILQFEKGGGAANAMIIKTSFRGTDNKPFLTLHYEDRRNKKFIDTLFAQLQQARFKCISKEADNLKKNWVFKKDDYIVTIYTFPDKILSWEVEIHEH